MLPRLSTQWHRTVALIQGSYYAATGLWPLLSLQTFQFITGRKTDTWLVQTVGLLVLAVAIPLLVAGIRGHTHSELRLLGLTVAIAFLIVDVAFYTQGRIGLIYLADALVEFLFALAWLMPGFLGHTRHQRPQPSR